MNPQLEHDQAEAPAFVAGDVVDLVNDHGLKVVSTIHVSGKRLLAPNPTRARVLAPVRHLPDGVPMVDVEITRGPWKGERAAVHPNALRLIDRPRPATDRARRRRWLGRIFGR